MLNSHNFIVKIFALICIYALCGTVGVSGTQAVRCIISAEFEKISEQAFSENPNGYFKAYCDAKEIKVKITYGGKDPKGENVIDLSRTVTPLGRCAKESGIMFAEYIKKLLPNNELEKVLHGAKILEVQLDTEIETAPNDRLRLIREGRKQSKLQEAAKQGYFFDIAK